jgi:hypothetical protein
MEERGFFFAKYETLHLLQWTQKHPKQHYGMFPSPHHRRSGKGGSPWGLMASHKYNLSN